jgi:hypothetical protein
MAPKQKLRCLFASGSIEGTACGRNDMVHTQILDHLPVVIKRVPSTLSEPCFLACSGTIRDAFSTSPQCMVLSPPSTRWPMSQQSMASSGSPKSWLLKMPLAALPVTPSARAFVHTPLVQKQIDDLTTQERISINEASAKLLREKQPSGRFTSVEDIAALALFLCSALLRQILLEHPFPSTADFRRLKEADVATSPTNQCCIVRCSTTCKGR